VSFTNIDIILDRIDSAGIESPIAIFLAPEKPKGIFKSVFASTVKGQNDIFYDAENFVGQFNYRVDQEWLRKKLNDLEAIEKPGKVLV